MGNINEISVINNSTIPDTSMNTTQLELINKLQENPKETKLSGKIDNFDA